MKLEKKKDSQIGNFRRRNFLKYFLIASGGFLAGKFLDSVSGLFSSKKASLKNFETCISQEGETRLFKNFVVKETEEELDFFDKEGYKIFVIEK
jgi:hypothetical protein